MSTLGMRRNRNVPPVGHRLDPLAVAVRTDIPLPAGGQPRLLATKISCCTNAGWLWKTAGIEALLLPN